MSESVYKVVQLVGSAPGGIEAAVDNALARAGQSLRHLRWFEITETRGHIVDGKVAHYQVALKVGFALDDEEKA
jgi:flavin-binding protein dodecin